MQVREVCNWLSRLLFCFQPKEYQYAITLYPFIFYRYTPELETRIHEFTHIHQIEKMGFIKFYLVWLWQTIIKGYQSNKLEVEAFQMQKDYAWMEYLSKKYPQLLRGIDV